MPDTMMWWHQNDFGPVKVMNPTHLTYPDWLSVTVLPENLKNLIKDKFENFQLNCNIPEINEFLKYMIKIMYRKDDSRLLEKLKHYLNETDQFRKQDFTESYPQFAELIDPKHI